MSSLALASENHIEPPSTDACQDSTISRPRYVVLQSLVGVMLAYQLLSGAGLIASYLTSVMVVCGLVAMVSAQAATGVSASGLTGPWIAAAHTSTSI